MPLSTTHRCLFIHIPKTGGTSIETALAMRGDRSREHKELLYGPIKSWRIRLKRPQTDYLQHLTYAEVSRIFPKVVKEQFFSFSFVRNPWARMVSVYSNPDRNLLRMAAKNNVDLNGLSFLEFLQRTKNMPHAHLKPQSDFICDDCGNVLIDFVGRFENLQSDFSSVCNRLKNGKEIALPWLNKSISKKNDNYQDFYCNQSLSIVNEKFSRDIEIFHYKFNSEQASDVEFI